MENNTMPIGYNPYQELVICSNSLINGKVPIKIDGHIPFLVGKGEIPQVWLSVPAPNGKWLDLIVSNKRKEIKSKTFKQFLLTIEESVEGKRIDISMWKTKILSVVQETDEKAIITSLDLRPFNLLIYGGSDGLHIGGQLLRGNTMKNVNTMIGIGQ